MKLYNADCLDILKAMPSKSVDLVVTDPPYDFITKHSGDYIRGGGCFGTDKREYQKILDSNNIVEGFNWAVIDELKRIMKRVNIYIWCNKEQIKDYLERFADYNFDLLTWHKTNPIPMCSNKYLSDTEYLLFFREKGVKIYGDFSTKAKYYISPLNTIDKKYYYHPTIKPLDFTERLIINSSQKGEVVLDPFMGSGTTGVACRNLDREFIGIEIDKTFFETAQRRIANECQQFTFDFNKEGDEIQ